MTLYRHSPPSGAFEASARRSSAFTFAKAPRDRAAARSSGEAPGPGAYDPAAAEPATRPSAPAASFEPRAPAEIRKPPATPKKEAEAEEEEPRSRTPFGGTTTGKSGAHVRFALAPERVTVVPIKGDVEEIERGGGSTQVVVDEGMNTVRERRARTRKKSTAPQQHTPHLTPHPPPPQGEL